MIDEDGQRCAVCDESGALVPATEVTKLLAAEVLRGHPGEALVLEPELPDGERQFGVSARPIAARSGSLAALSAALREHAAVFGGGTSGRYWFREAFPTSDGVLTLARILSALSRRDRALSELVACARPNRAS